MAEASNRPDYYGRHRGSHISPGIYMVIPLELYKEFVKFCDKHNVLAVNEVIDYIRGVAGNETFNK